jgi:SAM-dependent methyltransferase
MTPDPETFRVESRQRWEEVAPGWGRRREAMQRAALPVSEWMIDAIAPQPGHTILELAAGPGDTGFLAAELVEPGGKLISTDGAEAMVEIARRRAAELGLDNVEHRIMEAEWIDLPTASVDAVLCRWGFMLLADPETALRETRRVLKSGGRLALAAWDAPEHNPWSALIGAELAARGLVERGGPDEPGMFAFAPPGRAAALLDSAGFEDVVVDAVDFEFTAPSFDEWWESQFDLSMMIVRALAPLGPDEVDEVHDAVAARYAPYADETGALQMPARALVAAASG